MGSDHLDASDPDGFAPSGPPVLVAHDPSWAARAERHLAAIRSALAPVVADPDACAFDHIGSTAVPGLVAKDVVDLQVRLASIPDPAVLDAALAPLGWTAAVGSRPDSPGVVRDVPAPGDDEPAPVWAKRMFGAVEPAGRLILHVRLTASPSGRRTVAFRDRLRADPALREGYAALKTGLAAAHAGDADYDDYTRGKSAFVNAAAAAEGRPALR